MSYDRKAVTRRFTIEIWTVQIYDRRDRNTHAYTLPLIGEHTEGQALREFRKRVENDSLQVVDVSNPQRTRCWKQMSLERFYMLAEDVTNTFNLTEEEKK